MATSQEASAVEWGDNSERGEKWSGTGYILKLGPIGCTDVMDVGGEKKKENKGTSKDWGLRIDLRGYSIRGCVELPYSSLTIA